MSFIYNMADTWNAGGTTFNGIYMNISNGAGGAPVGAAASRAFRLDANSAAIFSFDVNGTVAIGAEDTYLTRDAANTLAQRNGVNAQTFRIYNTFTDASNYE